MFILCVIILKISVKAHEGIQLWKTRTRYFRWFYCTCTINLKFHCYCKKNVTFLTSVYNDSVLCVVCVCMLLLYVQLSDVVHSVAMQLEGRTDPATTWTLITIPAERAQLSTTLRTQQLHTQKKTGGYHKDRWQEQWYMQYQHTSTVMGENRKLEGN